MVCLWFGFGAEIGRAIGFAIPQDSAKEAGLIGLDYLFSARFLWFDTFFILSSIVFFVFWRLICPTKWALWSVLGSCGITFLSYCTVEYAVAFNNWLGPYMNLVQDALTTDKDVQSGDLYSLLISGDEIFAFGAIVFVLNRFLISHFIFRWRTAMSDYYINHWHQVRHIEGASQRVQEDTMKFANIMEKLGVNFVEAVMTLIAFIPVLATLSVHVTELPVVGKIPYPLCFAAFFFAVFGTMFLGLLGLKLPGLEYENQKVEAAYRKELVMGEDDPDRAEVGVLQSLYSDIRKNYFRLYFHYCYFNFGRQILIYTNWIFMLFILAPTIVAGSMTFGIFGQIRLAFWEVSHAFQYLIKSWPEVVDMLSVYKRLYHFEQAIEQYKEDGLLPEESAG